MATDPVLVLEGVVKTYGEGERALEVLHGIDLEVRAGELTCLIGPSGSGKSTLLNLLGLLDRPTRGRVHLTGVDTTDLDDAERTRLRNRALGFVFQFHHLVPALSAEENVRMPLALATGRMSASLRPRALELLDAVGLLDRADSPAGQLSGGQQQRVSPSRARWWHRPRWCSPTSRPATSTPGRPTRCSSSSGASTASAARRS